MTDVIAGQSVSLLSQWYDQQGGTLTNLDALPTITITSVATGATALAATSSGITHPGTGSYGYVWTPASSLTAGLYLATWAGTASGSPVTASETITVTAPATANATNTSPDGVWYATREEIKAELDVKETSRSNARIDRALEDASRRVEGQMHRRFFPVVGTRYFDWPARTGGYTPWILRFDGQELISVTTLASGGETISADEYNLEPNRLGPPFTRIEIRQSANAAFGGGSTYQRDIQVTGLWGYRNTEATVGTLAEALDGSETGVDVDAATSAAVGVGSVLRVDSERMLVTGRAQLSTGQTLGADLTNINNSVTVAVQSGAVFAAGEVILIDAERMLVEDVVGNNLIVRRAWDGSTIAVHTNGATIYAPRTLTVTRGALGTTADTHANGSTVSLWIPPGPVRQLTIAEALTDLLQGRSGYARTAGSGDNERETSGKGLADLRASVYAECGRKARMRSV